jgi:putative glutamine amidotransferase
MQQPFAATRHPERRPIIGITSDVRPDRRTMIFLFEEYSRAIEHSGGLPLQVPPLEDPTLATQVLGAIDGIVIVGGEDIDPREYGEEPLPTHQALSPARYAFDRALAQHILSGSIPTLGICYGCQLLAVVSGGSLVQDIPSQIGTAVPHSGRYPSLPMHPVEIARGSKLAAIVGADSIEVNSAHHQAPRRLGPGLVECARASDGVIEAFEGTGERFLLGLEWHPELLYPRGPERAIFHAFVAEAAKTAARRLDPAGIPR